MSQPEALLLSQQGKRLSSRPGICPARDGRPHISPQPHCQKDFTMKKDLRTFLRATAATSFVLIAATAQAQSKPDSFYGEIGYTQINYKEAGYSIKPSVVRAMIGTEVHPNLAIEGMLGMGIADDSTTIRGVKVTGEINNTWGIFAKPKAAITPELDVFARLGYAKTKIAASVPGYSMTDSGGSTAYGLGASYKLSKQVSANVDYMSYYNKNGVKGTGMTLGVGFKF